MLDFQAARWLQMHEVAKQAGNNHPTSIPTGVFRTSDGHINIASTGQVMWERLCQSIGAPELIDHPDYKTSAWLEYRMPSTLFGSDEFFVRTQWSYTGDSVNRLEPLDPATQPNAQFHNPAYTIGDLRAGLVGEDWQVDVFVNNITDDIAQYTTQTGLYEWGFASIVDNRPHHQTVYTNRPREFGVRFMKRWGD